MTTAQQEMFGPFEHSYDFDPDAVARAATTGLVRVRFITNEPAKNGGPRFEARWRIGEWLASGGPTSDPELYRVIVALANYHPGTLKRWTDMALRWREGERDKPGTAFTVYQDLVFVTDEQCDACFEWCAAYRAENGTNPGHKNVRDFLASIGVDHRQLALDVDPPDIIWRSLTGEDFRG